MANLNVPINANVIDPNIQLPGPSNPLILPIDFTSSTLYFNDPNEKIIEFLKHDYEGLVVLSTFEFKSEKCLTDDARNLLVKKLIDREINIFLTNLNYKIGVQLNKFKIESSRFQLLADEIGETFNEEPGIYFTPFTHEGNIKINANGKLWDRYNYVKKVLRNAGILKPIVNTPVQPETPLVTVELSDGDVVEKLEFLKTNLEPWDVITQYWNETYIARKNTLKNNELSPISIHRCLHQQSGILLIHDDFKQLFSNKLNAVSTRWDFLEQFIEQYAKIDSQLADNSEAKNLIAALSSLTGHNKQVALLLLLGFMLKPTNIKPLTPKNSKKRKLDETVVEKPFDKTIQSLGSSTINDFLVRAENEAKVNEIIDNKKTIALKKKLPIQPYMIFVGSSSQYKSFYVITDIIKYKVSDPLEALQLNFELFYVFDWKYPQSCYNIWIFIQRVVFGISVPGNHYCVKMKKMMGHITRRMKINLD